ncbi:glycine zipper family protein [Cupriavidus agavae]|nr:glycine zipper family protein [Cupriavidus agavae]
MTSYRIATNETPESRFDVQASLMPVRGFFFAVVDEVGKDGFLVRKVYEVATPEAIAQSKLPEAIFRLEMNPEKYGVLPRAPESNVSIGWHVRGQKFSPYMSFSATYPQGPSRLIGRPTYIDIRKALGNGAVPISQAEIQADLDRHLKKYPHASDTILQFKKWSASDREVLLRGEVPPAAVFNKRSLAVTRSAVRVGRVVQVVGVFFTAYDLKIAAGESTRLHSVKPISKEVLRQVGGWGGALAGAKLGASLGTTFGITTGPGVIVTGLAGGFIFGALGYFGADSMTREF